MDKLYRTLNRLKSSRASQESYKREGFFGLYGRKVGLVDYYEKKLEDLQENIRKEQSSASLLGKV